MHARKSIYFVLPVVALVLMSCSFGNVSRNWTDVEGSGTLKTEERPVSDVERVSLEGIGDLEIVQGNEEGLTVKADDNLLAYIETEMRGRELVIRVQNGIRLDTRNPIRYTLRVKNLDRVSISGSGNVHAAALDTGDFELAITGSGNFGIDTLQAEDLQVRISGSGNVDLVGEVQTQEISITGSGDVSAGQLASRRTDISVSGSGNMTVWASEELQVRISGMGNIDYYGSPTVDQTITGSGKVNSLGEPD